MSLWREIWSDGAALLRGWGAAVWSRRGLWALGLVLGAAAVLLLYPGDLARVRAWFTPQDPEWVAVARRASAWGELHMAPLLCAAALWTAGAALRRRVWRRAALAAILGAALAGLVAAAAKGMIGRPRPFVALGEDPAAASAPGDWRGPTLDHRYQSLPSGHATHSFGLVGALAVAAPPLALPAAAGAGIVCWSRMYLHRHYAGDVVAGMTLGLAIGAGFGLAARRLGRTVRGEALPD